MKKIQPLDLHVYHHPPPHPQPSTSQNMNRTQAADGSTTLANILGSQTVLNNLEPQEISLQTLSNNREVLNISSKLAQAIDDMKTQIKERTFYESQHEMKAKQAQYEKFQKNFGELIQQIGYSDSVMGGDYVSAVFEPEKMDPKVSQAKKMSALKK